MSGGLSPGADRGWVLTGTSATVVTGVAGSVILVISSSVSLYLHVTGPPRHRLVT